MPDTPLISRIRRHSIGTSPTSFTASTSGRGASAIRALRDRPFSAGEDGLQPLQRWLGCLLAQPIHLALHKLPIGTFAAQQKIGRSVLHDVAGLQDDDAVETAHGRKPVRYRDNGA